MSIVQISKSQTFLFFLLFCSHHNVGGCMDEAESFVRIHLLHLHFHTEKIWELYVCRMNNFIYREIIGLPVLDLLHI